MKCLKFIKGFHHYFFEFFPPFPVSLVAGWVLAIVVFLILKFSNGSPWCYTTLLFAMPASFDTLLKINVF
ncbi:hypothetical protein BCBMB205_31330 [Bacillus velezensis]|nr:hypothetical protein BCBMB205_31330 [Bacillus velezensis]